MRWTAGSGRLDLDIPEEVVLAEPMRLPGYGCPGMLARLWLSSLMMAHRQKTSSCPFATDTSHSLRRTMTAVLQNCKDRPQFS